MIQIIRTVSADVVKRGATRQVYAKQNDLNSRFLNVHIQEDGKDIIVNANSTVILNVQRPDKLENMFYGSVNEDGTVQIPLTSWMLELEGTLLCDISIVYEGVAKLTTMQFNMYVEAAVCSDESIIETEDYSVIVDLLKRTEAATKNSEELRENCETATKEATKAKEDVDSALSELAEGGFIKSMVEQNKGEKISYWIGTRAEYDALEVIDPKRCYIVTGEGYTPEKIFVVTVPADIWSQDTEKGGYVCTIPVEGIYASDNPTADIVLGDDISANEQSLNTWLLVTRIVTADNSITLYANKGVPEETFTMKLKAVR